MSLDDKSYKVRPDESSNEFANWPGEPIIGRITMNWRLYTLLTSIALLVIVLISAGGYLALSSRESTNPITTALPSATLRPMATSGQGRTSPSVSPIGPPPSLSSSNQDLPPLYPNILWDATKSGKLTVEDDNGSSVHSTEVDVFVNEAFGLESFPNDMFGYYDRELSLRGWVQGYVAQAPNGQHVVYMKDGHYFSIEAMEEKPGQYVARIKYN
jgi:hypothetical protein